MSEQKRFTLRIDQDLFKEIEERAKTNKRSIAKEIEYLVESHLKREKEKEEN